MFFGFRGIDSGAPSGMVTAQFRLEKRSFCVGEPILIEFSVFNGSNQPYHFLAGGDYRGTLRHERFSFKVKNDAGRDFTQKIIGNHGGLGGTETIEPGKKLVDWQLLNPWTHLLPPGHYFVQCSIRLADDGPLPPKEEPRERSKSLDFSQQLEFDITGYDKLQILSVIRQLKTKESTWGTVDPDERVNPKPLDWALDDLAEKFQTGIIYTKRDAKYERDVLFALPWVWDDRYFAEYDLGSQRNWINAETYRDAGLTFSVLNNSNHPLPLRFMESSLFVNGVEAKDWQKVVRSAIKAARLDDIVEPGALIKIKINCTEFLTKSAVWKFVWKVDGFSKDTQISYLNR
jgi:hypothetical protein